MERALHPDLVKRSLAADGSSVAALSVVEMIDATEEGIGRTRDPGTERRRIEIRIDHVHDDIATVTVTCAVYVDYLHLVRTRGGWKIVNVLWEWVASK
jgi:Putative lumazine-binding